MNIVVRCGKKFVSREIHHNGAQSAFSAWRHEQTDYNFKRAKALAADKGRTGPAYDALVDAVVEAALAMSNNPKWVAVVKEWAANREWPN